MFSLPGATDNKGQRNRCALAGTAASSVTARHWRSGWVAGHRPEVVVMESTGIYWKSPYAALEDVGIAATVVMPGM